MAIEIGRFGELDGNVVNSFTLTNRNGLRARLIEYGATLTELHVPDRQGRLDDIVLGFDDLAGYRADLSYSGAIVGRCANRIAGGRFLLDGRAWQLPCNEGGHHLHGGVVGFNRMLWRGSADAAANAVRFAYSAADGEEGYPGRLDIAVTYRLDDADCLTVEMMAATDRPTLCNPVQHGYWNLAGHDSGDVLAQELRIDADFYTPADAELIPTGEVLPVAGTPLDFRDGKAIGRDLAALPGGHYDHNLVLRGEPGRLRPVLRAIDPGSGRGLDLATTEPGLQLYTGVCRSVPVRGKSGTSYPPAAGFTLETQKWPDAANRPHFPSARLDPGQAWRHVMAFRFSAA